MTKIFIEGYELDLTKGLSNQITYAIDDLQNLDSKSTSFTKTIILPGTANNNKLLGNIFEFNNANFDNPLDPNVLQNFNASRNAVARIEIDGLQIMKGVLRLLEIIQVDGSVEYECAIFGELGGFINALGNKRLEDLDFSAYNHTYSYANIVASWDTSGSTGYCYPLIDYGNVSTGLYGTLKKDFQYTTFKPALFVRDYINKIFSQSGYTYESALFDTSTFRNLIIPNNQKQLTKETNNVLELTKAIGQAMNTGGTQDFISYETKVGSLFTASVGNTTFTYTGTPTLTTNLTIEIRGDYNLAVRPLTIAILKNGAIVPGSSQTYNGSDLLFYSKTLDVSFATNDTLRVRTTCVLDGGDSVYIDESTISVLNSVVTTAPIELGDQMIINNTIPKGIFQKDFITSIIKMFNLMIVEDKYKTNHLIIKPYVDFYDGSIIDWSDKMDRSKAIKIKPMSEINARYYNFKYKQDNDFYNEDYRKKFNEGYGDRLYDNGLEFAKDTESVEVVFASSPLFGTSTTDKVFPAIYKKSNENTKEDPMDHVMRIVQVKKISGVASWAIYNAGTSLGTNTTYLYAGHLNDPTNPSIDLNFGAPQQLFFNLTSGNLSNNLFNVYYSPYMSEITDKDSRLLTGFFDLKELDIYNLDFAKFIFIDGGLYRLSKVNEYSTEANDTTKVELLRVIDKFSIVIDTTPNWVSQGFNTCSSCATYLVFRDLNPSSPTYNNYRVNGVNVGNTAPTSGDCNTTGTWTSQSYTTCINCANLNVERDTNACSATYNQYRAGGVVLGFTAPPSGACNVTPNFVSQGYNTCVGCTNYLVFRDDNPCSPTYNNYRVNGVNVGNTAPTSGNCNTTANWTSQMYVTCVNCNSYLVYRDTNPCSATYNNYRVNGVNVGNTAPTLGACNTDANWVNNGSTFCSSCVAYQPQIDNNPCSATYNNTRNVNLGATSPCVYTANYSNNVGNLYVCNVPGGGVNTYIVYQNTNACFTGNQFFANGNSYATNPSNSYPDTTQNWQPNGANYCSGVDLYQPQIQTNPCAVNYNGVRDQLIEANSSSCSESYIMRNCLGGGGTTFSATYVKGSFSVNERVTNSGVIYVITSVTSPFAGIPITTTGLTGCPSYTQFTDLCTSNSYYIFGTGYSSVGTSSDIPEACLQPTGTTETPTGTQIYNFTSNPGCECV
jgi:hypothetical protein